MMNKLKPKLLAVDLTDDVMELLKNILQDLNIECETSSSSGGQILDSAGNDYVLIMVDTSGPDVINHKELKSLTQSAESEGIPLLHIMTENKDPEYFLKYSKSGIVDYMMKPVIPQILSNKINLFIRFYGQKKEFHKIHKALDDSNGAVGLTELSGDFLYYINMEFGYLFELTPSDLKTATLGSLFADPGQGKGILEDVNLNSQWEGEVNMRNKSGKIFPAELRISIIEDENYNSMGYLLLCSDITARKEAEKKLKTLTQNLQDSNKELEQFAYVASHDLQEPLRVINSYLQLIETQFRNSIDDNKKHYISRTMNAAERMRDMIKSLLMYSRITTKGNLFVECSLESILEDVLQNLESSITEKKAVVTHDSLPNINADRSQMIRLLQNLISNALKFCKVNSPEVHISAKKEIGSWIIKVQDNGIGIEEEYQGKIFDIFQRLHSRAHYEGTGIGLAACRKIVERHGGKIWVESEIGKGSNFYFSIGACERK